MNISRQHAKIVYNKEIGEEPAIPCLPHWARCSSGGHCAVQDWWCACRAVGAACDGKERGHFERRIANPGASAPTL